MIRLASPSFNPGGPMNPRHTRDGEDLSPPLAWSGVPARAERLALVVDDLDAGGWVHWLIYDLPAGSSGLGEGVPPDAELGDGARQGVNGYGGLGWGGPCPPSGLHRYRFRLIALDAPTGLPARASREALERAVRGRSIAIGELIGRYGGRGTRRLVRA